MRVQDDVRSLLAPASELVLRGDMAASSTSFDDELASFTSASFDDGGTAPASKSARGERHEYLWTVPV